METWRKILLIVLGLAAAVSIYMTWGSVFSIIMTLGILTACCMLLLQKFVFNDRDNDYWGDQNG